MTTTKKSSHERWAEIEASEQWAEYVVREMAMPGYITLMVLPDTEHYMGLVERSFSLDTSLDRTQFFWSSNNAVDNIVGAKWVVDGFSDAVYRASQYEDYYPGATIHIIDARDEEIMPVILDWDRWLHDGVSRSWFHETESFGVMDKFGDRNPKFTVDTTKPFLASVPGGTNWRERYEVMKADRERAHTRMKQT